MLIVAFTLLTPLLSGAPLTNASGDDDTNARRGGAAGQCSAVQLRAVLADTRVDRSTPAQPAMAADREGRRPLREKAFSAVRTLDIELRSRLRQTGERHARLEFRLYTPKGHLYQKLRAETVPNGVPARFGTASLPTAGTTIVNSSLYGRWRVEPHLDGDVRPCAPAVHFWIDP
jgi:hypothetical protein